MTMVWIRHGETAHNASGIIQPEDTPLSARGLAQAAAVAARIATLSPVALLTSDLPRARQTADAVAAATGLAVRTDPVLRERNFGDWRGRPRAGLGVDPLSFAAAPPGGESMAAFTARAAQAWARALALRAGIDGTLVIVSHGLLIDAALRRHARWPPGLQAPAWLANTAVSIVDAPPDTVVRLAGCVAHLDRAADPGGATMALPC